MVGKALKHQHQGVIIERLCRQEPRKNLRPNRSGPDARLDGAPAGERAVGSRRQRHRAVADPATQFGGEFPRIALVAGGIERLSERLPGLVPVQLPGPFVVARPLRIGLGSRVERPIYLVAKLPLDADAVEPVRQRIVRFRLPVPRIPTDGARVEPPSRPGAGTDMPGQRVSGGGIVRSLHPDVLSATRRLLSGQLDQPQPVVQVCGGQ